MRRSVLSSVFVFALGAILTGLPITPFRADANASSPVVPTRGEIGIPERDNEWCRPCPLPPISIPRETNVLALKKTDISVRVIGPLAEVTVIQHYHNPSSTPITVGYTFPLPGDAALRDLEIKIGDRWLRAELKEVEEARRIYDEAEQAGHGAVLVEERRENVFRARIANVEPGRELAIRMRYAQRVPVQSGRYRLTFPSVVAPRYCPVGQDDAALFNLPYVPSGLPGHAIDIRVDLDATQPLLDIGSPSHAISIAPPSASSRSTLVSLSKVNEVPNRDFVLTWKVADDAVRTGLWVGTKTDAGTPFLLVAYPDRATASTRRKTRDVIFILDSSGSMTGVKFEAARRAVRGLLRGLETGDRFRLVDFDDDYNTLSDRALEFSQDSLDRADRWLDAVSADGGTEILKPVSYALRLPDDRERDRYVILLTDGQVGNENEVLEEVTRHRGNARIFTLGIDYAVNDAMLKGMARLGRGSCSLITPDEDVEGAVLALKGRLREPVLAQLALDAPTATLFPDPLPDLWPDEPLVVLGRFTGSIPASITLRAQRNGESWSSRIATDSTETAMNLDAVVAAKEIEGLIDRGRASGRSDETRRDVIARSLRHRVSSPFTAFVVVERREITTETGAVRRVEVPVAFPQGWDWQNTMGDYDAAKTSGYALARRGRANAPFSIGTAFSPSPAAPHSYAARYSSAAGGALDDNTVSEATTAIAPEIAARRYLARNQRADGFWMVAGKSEARATALALLGLLKDYTAFRAECDRAIHALKSLPRNNQDAVASLLVQLALEEALAVTGNAATAPTTRIRPALTPGDKTSDDAAVLAQCAAVWLWNRSNASDADALVARLEPLATGNGSDAGAIKLGTSDTILATAVYVSLHP